MRIAHLDLGRELRGGQRQVLYLARYLAGQTDADTLLLCPRRAPLAQAARQAGVETVELPGRRSFNPRLFLAANHALKTFQADVVHTHCARSASLGALLKLMGGLRFRLVHTRRVSYPPGKGWWSLEKYRLADKLAAVSAEIAEVMAAHGLERRRLEVIHSGIDPARYGARSDLGGERIIGFIGALSPQKGVEVLLRALAILDEKPPGALPAWRAVIVGQGKLHAPLRRLARSLGLAERVRFAGFQESRKVLPLFHALAAPSVAGEGSSGVIKEAWASSVPVVTSNLPSNLELVRDAESGLVVPPGDPEALAGALAMLLGDDALHHRLEIGGLERVRQFTDTAMAQKYVALYQNLFAPPADPAPPPGPDRPTP